MSSDIVLTAALRSNLSSLQSTQNLIDRTQNRLATGLKVNSALDGAQNFFAAQTLGNRANDLSRLLDGIGQSIRTIEAADNGVTALTDLVNQADSIATQAADALASATNNASVTGSADLSGITDLTSLAGVTAGDQFTVQVGSASAINVEITSGLGVDGLLAELNDISNVEARLNSDGQLVLGTTNGESLRLANSYNTDTGTASTSLTASTGLGFTTVNAGASVFTLDLRADTELYDNLGDTSTTFTDDDTFTISVDGGAATTITVSDGDTLQELLDDINAISGVTALFDADNDYVNIVSTSGNATVNLADGTGTPLADSAAGDGTALSTNPEVDPRDDGTTFIAGNVLSRTFVENSDSSVPERTDALNTVTGFTDLDSNDTVIINIGNGNFTTFDAADSISDIVDSINSDSNNGSTAATKLVAAYDDETGEFTLTIGADVSSVSITTDTNADGTEAFDFNFGNAVLDIDRGGVAVTARYAASTGATDTEISQLEDDYNNVRAQIDQLVADSGYAGVNLLNGGNLITVFNEDGTSSITSEGVDFTAAGLGITAGSFGSTGSINTSLAQISAALDTVRNFGNTLANDLTVIETRQSFTESTIDTLAAGANDLTVADQNEEGANLLALQTRQQLGITSLSLASQAAQSILRLF